MTSKTSDISETLNYVCDHHKQALSITEADYWQIPLERQFYHKEPTLQILKLLQYSISLSLEEKKDTVEIEAE